MDDKEVEMLARHLGHDVSTHKSWYRLAHSTLELSKVSHLLLAIESGHVNKWKGKKLADIPMEELPGINQLLPSTSASTSSQELPGFDQLLPSTSVSTSSQELPGFDQLLLPVSASDQAREDHGDNRNSSGHQSDILSFKFRNRVGKRKRPVIEDDDEDDVDSKPKMKRRAWTKEENSTMSSFFKKHLTGLSKRVRNSDLEAAKKEFPCLHNRTLPQMRTKLNNIKLGKFLE